MAQLGTSVVTKSDKAWDRFDDYVIAFALDRMRAGERIALVTLVKIEGSSPRPLGAQMAVSESAEWVGYLSGGCIERAVVAEALSALEEGQNRRVRYGRGSKYFDIQLPCGSAIELVFDVHISESELAAISADINCRRVASLSIPGNIAGFATQIMVRKYYPMRRLIVAGVGPSTLQLMKIAGFSGFETALYSPDSATRNEAALGGLLALSIVSTTDLPDFHADENSAIVFMFHDHEWERKLLPAALETDAFYIGALGSRRTHSQRMEALEQLGVDPVQLARIHGPAGLFSGAKSAPEVAMSILAEIMQVASSKDVQNLLLLQDINAYEPSTGRSTLQRIGSDKARGV